MPLFLIIILVIVIVFIVIGINKHKKEQEEQRRIDEERAKKERQKKEARERSRKIYWNNLPRVYNNQTPQALKNAYSLLRTLDSCNRDIGNPNFREELDIWSDANEKIIKVLNYPTWVYGNGSSYTSDTPIHYDLDMKYILTILNK